MRKLFLGTLLAVACLLGVQQTADAALQYSTTHRSNVMTQLVTDAGATAYLMILTGAQPATVATVDAGTVLVSMAMNTSTIGTVSNGVLTMTISAAMGGTATGTSGTAGHFLICTTSSQANCVAVSSTTRVAQGAVAVSASDLNFAGGVIWTSGETISITSFTITASGS